jgi:MoxR-like ATPase
MVSENHATPQPLKVLPPLPLAPKPLTAQDAYVGKPTSVSASATSNPSENLIKAENIIDRIVETYSRRVVGQESLRESLMVALISGGHILLESVPGLAKTTAAQTLASTISADFKRIQCTPDLLPSDIIGTQIYEQHTGVFRTQLGPVHANFVLLDEINRSSAKTQSAMLEAMQEKQTSIGGVMYQLPSPFLVIATQNPIEQEGTYHLPEAQLDRFIIKEIVQYATPDEEFEILRRVDEGVLGLRSNIGGASVALEEVVFLQDLASKVYVDTTIRQYIINIVYATRNPKGIVPVEMERFIEYGGSPRASIAFLQASRALALLNGRENVIPEDIKALAHRILRHRLILNFEADVEGVTPEMVIDQILSTVPSP